MTVKHRHHILPRHAGGTDDPDNFVEVTVEEHAELHLSLFLEYGRYEDWIACQGLAGLIDKAQLLYELNVLQASRPKGPHSEETKAKMRKPHGPKHGPESRERIRQSRLGTPHSEQTKAKISASMTRYYDNNNTIKS